MGPNGKMSKFGPNWAHGLKWAQMGAIGRKWAQLGPIGLNWAQLGSIGRNWAQMGSIGPNWAQLGSIGRKLEFEPTKINIFDKSSFFLGPNI